MGPKIVALVMFVALTACQITGGGSFCAVAKPLRFSPEAITAMSDQEVGDALAHDRKGQRLCGWNP